MANNNRALQRLCIAGVSAATLIAGLPFVGATAASAAHVADIEFYSPSLGTTELSSKFDGTDNTAKLLVDAPANVTSVAFSYALVSDPTVFLPISVATARPFAVNFNTLTFVAPEDIILRAVGTTNVGGTTDPVDYAVQIDNTADTVNVTAPSSTSGSPTTLGTFNDKVIVRGTVSPGYAGDVVLSDVLGTDAGPALGSTVTVLNADLTAEDAFAALVPTSTPTSAAAYIRADVGTTDETELASLYEQLVQVPTLTAGSPATAITAINDVPGGAGTDITVKVVDQNGAVIGDALVELDLNRDGDSTDVLDGETSDRTGVDGTVVFTVDDFDDGVAPAGGTRQIDINVNQTNDAGFNSAVGDKRLTITQTTATPAAPVATTASIEAYDPSPSTVLPGSGTTPRPDFPAGTTTFDTAEDVQTRLRVADQTGAALPNASGFYTVTYTDEAGVVTPATPTPVAFTTNGQGFADLNIDETVEGTFRVTAYVNRDSDAAQTAGDLVLAPVTFLFDSGDIVSDAPQTSQAEAGTTVSRGFTYRLENGTVLPGRVVDLDLNRIEPVISGGAIFSTTQPAGTTRIDNDNAYGITDASGRVVASVTDPVTDTDDATAGVQQQTETINLEATVRDAGRSDDTDIVFIVGATPAEIGVVAVTELVDGAATPGRPVEVLLNVDTIADALGAGDTGTGLGGVQVSLTTDKGYFTSRDNPTSSNSSVGSLTGAVPATTPTAAGAPVGAFRRDAQPKVMTTGSTGNIRFSVAIDRDADFDDDGLAVVNVTAVAGGVTRVIPITFSTNEFSSVTTAATAGGVSYTLTGEEPLNAAAADALQIVPFDGADTTDVSSAQQDGVPFELVGLDQFGNRIKVDVDNLSIDNGGGLNVTDDDTSYTGETTPDFRAFSSLDDDAADTGAEETSSHTITASEGFDATTFADDDVVTAGFQYGAGNYATSINGNVVSDTQTVSFYRPIADQFVYTFASTPGNTVTVGTAVNTVVTVKDQRGNPVEGLDVDFVRSGPGEQADTDNNNPTNASGQAGYTFTSPTVGRAVVTVIVSDSNNIELSRGVQNVDFIQAAQGTSVSIDATPLVRWPGAPVITGVLRNAAGDPLPGRVVNIIYKQQAVAGLAAFRPVLRLTTDANGVYRGSIRPTVNAVWQAIYLGNNAEGASGSAYDVTKVQVANPTVNGFGTTLTVRSTRTVNFSGIVTPGSVRHPVVVQWIRTDGIFNLTAPKRADAVGNYVTGRTFAPGTYRLRVLGVNTANNVASASRTVTLRVVR